MTSISDMPGEKLADLLMRGASGIFLYEAAVLLLRRHGLWLEHPGFRRFIVVEPDGQKASVDLKAAMPALDSGSLTADTGDWLTDDEAAKILRIVASLSGTYPVLLREVVEGIDRENIKYVAEAIMYADGFLSSQADPR
ncbi:hypothetical protein Rhe02_65530 [Rhizocola hellebori]|uniref:Uncharacterized protein n=1 Tax=Rhizocola hellebori TaxID=1392758 RepID=A0A8J3VJW6_9ACTN|nr:hypothetical protein [Rhizocola hellebori]GIH08486.1 hypothetical protein Rhe02_65530 [Rhizocola hellebori]